MDLISVIIPVYNVELYLRKCIESVQNQTYGNLEIFIIDDGSTDGCPEICDEYAMKDSRIQVIHQKNAGLSAARNRGLDIAHGEYIFFVDSDDYLDSEALSILKEKIEKFHADVAMCEHLRVDEAGKALEENVQNSVSDQVLTGKQLLIQNAIGNGKLQVVVWNKLYRKYIFENIRFEYKKQHEDEFIFHEICNCCNTIVNTPKKLYFYRQRKGSIMGRGVSSRSVDELEAFIRRILYMNKLKGAGMEEACECTFVTIYKLAFWYSKELGFDNFELNNLAKRYRKEIFLVLPFMFKILDKSMKEKIQFAIWLLSPRICGELWRFEKNERE